MILLTFTSLLQILVPMRVWSSLLGNVNSVPAVWVGKTTPRLPQRAANSVEKNAALLVRLASQKLLWEPSCLAQATATQMLLRHKHSGGVVVIGLRKEAQHSPSGTAVAQWSAHAWLLGKEGSLSGGAAAEGFVATTIFSLPQGLQPDDISFPLESTS